MPEQGGVATLDELVRDLVVANRVLAQQGVLDGFGHVSVRDPTDAGRYLISRSLAPELVSPEDVMVFDLDSKAVGGDARQPYLERFIHGEVYRARPEVQAVVHSHAPPVIPFAASSVGLRPVYHMSSFLARGAPVFDIRARFGATDMLVRNGDQGRALAEALGRSDVALMRGHGFVAVAPSIPHAVYRALYTMLNATLQQQAIALGGAVTYLAPDEAERSDLTNQAAIARPWQLWKRQVQAAD
jgi:ribulose-5-phosphate 4-epimerase/fuculose-1-phosphate aldolase